MTTVVNLTGCTVNAVRADMLKGRVKVTFETHLDDEMLEAKRMLALLAVDESPVDLVITEQQMRLPFKTFEEASPMETKGEHNAHQKSDQSTAPIP